MRFLIIAIFFLAFNNNLKLAVAGQAVIEEPVTERVAIPEPINEEDRLPNLLIDSKSEYLKSHAYDLMDWYEFNSDTIEKARTEDKLIYLNISKSNCYICGLMQKNTFNNDIMSYTMNSKFINSIIDSEINPELAHIYTNAIAVKNIIKITNEIKIRPDIARFQYSSLTEPYNFMIRTDLLPVEAHAYLPYKFIERSNKFNSFQKAGKIVWNNSADSSLKFGQEEADKIKKILNPINNKDDIEYINNKPVFKEALEKIKDLYDAEDHGFSSPIKKVKAPILNFLISNANINQNNDLMVLNTIRSILSLGIHDHVNGGFFEHTTDMNWKRPRFRKNLIDQALAIDLLINNYKNNSNLSNKIAIERTITFIKDNLTDDNGRFYSSTAPDIDGFEGKYYSWNMAKLKSVADKLSKEKIFTPLDLMIIGKSLILEPITKTGFENIEENSNILLFKKQLDGIEKNKLNEIYSILNSLKIYNDLGQKPNIDKKSITAWNALLANSLIRASITFDNKEYLELGLKNIDFLVENMFSDKGELQKIFEGGKKSIDGNLEDYSYLTKSLLSAYKATDDKKYLNSALKLIETTEIIFQQEAGDFILKPKDNILLFKIMKYDETDKPSGNAMMASIYIDLYEISDNKAWLDKANKIFENYATVFKYDPARYIATLNQFLRYKNLKK